MKKLIVVVFSLIATIALAATGGGYSAPDPFVLTLSSNSVQYPFCATAGKSLRATQNPNPAVKSLYIISSGQSNRTNITPSAYTPTNGTVIDNLSFCDGGVYTAADPQLGTTLNPTIGPGHIMFNVADSFIGVFTKVTIVPVAVGGTFIADWETGYAKDYILIALRRLAAKGITNTGNTTIIVEWGQGESDCQAGTNPASYTTSLNNIIAHSRIEGFNGFWFVAGETWIAGAGCPTLNTAQLAVVNHPANVWASANADAIVGSICSAQPCRQADNTHFSDAGRPVIAAAIKTAIQLVGAPFI